jgi:predicted RND superfamily exporter protein
MLSFLSPQRLARRSAQHPWLTLGVWAVLIVVGVFSAMQIKFDEKQTIVGADSERAQQLIDKLRGGTPPTENVVIQSVGPKVDDASYRAFVAELVSEARRLKGVKSVSSYYETQDASLVSKDRTKMVLTVVLTGDVQKAADTVGPLVDLL